MAALIRLAPVIHDFAPSEAWLFLSRIVSGRPSQFDTLTITQSLQIAISSLLQLPEYQSFVGFWLETIASFLDEAADSSLKISALDALSKCSSSILSAKHSLVSEQQLNKLWSGIMLALIDDESLVSLSALNLLRRIMSISESAIDMPNCLRRCFGYLSSQNMLTPDLIVLLFPAIEESEAGSESHSPFGNGDDAICFDGRYFLYTTLVDFIHKNEHVRSALQAHPQVQYCMASLQSNTALLENPADFPLLAPAVMLRRAIGLDDAVLALPLSFPPFRTHENME